MSNKAKVTVVIPNYNGLKFMDPCFKALDLQLCRDFDILVSHVPSAILRFRL